MLGVSAKSELGRVVLLSSYRRERLNAKDAVSELLSA